MSAPPLTHHDILALLLPFTAAGWRVDLAASDRAARRLVFRPMNLTRDAATPAGASSGGLVSEGLNRGPAAAVAVDARSELHAECRVDGSFDVTRRQVGAGGLHTVLVARGRDAAALLAAMAAVPLARHFVAGPGWVLARNFSLEPVGAGGSLRFTDGRAQLDGLTLTLKVLGPALRAADVAITPAADRAPPALPEDLLAVQGWSWARLVADRSGWTSRMRLPRNLARRHAAAEAALDQAAAHLARTLGEGPAQWHPRHRLARWGVFFRRGIPTGTVVLLLGSLLVATQLDIRVDRAPGLWVALYHVPTLLIAVSFMFQELARFEIPPLPQRLQALQWWDDAQLAHARRAATDGELEGSLPVPAPTTVTPGRSGPAANT